MSRRPRRFRLLHASFIAVLIVSLIGVVAAGDARSTAQTTNPLAWLRSAGSPVFTLFGGASASAEGLATVDGVDGSATQILQQGDGKALGLHRPGGRLFALDATRDDVPSAAVAGSADAELVEGGGVTYLVNSTTGEISLVELRPTGVEVRETLRLKRKLSNAVVDDEGTLWAVVRSRGVAIKVKDGKQVGSPVDLGGPASTADGADLTLVDGAPVAVTKGDNPRAWTFPSGSGKAKPIPLPAGGANAIVGGGDGGVLVVVDTDADKLVSIDPEAGTAKGDPSPVQGEVGRPVVVGPHVLIPEFANHVVVVIEHRSGKVIARIPIEGGRDDVDIHVINGMAFVNDSTMSTIAVVDQGRVSTYDKGIPALEQVKQKQECEARGAEFYFDGGTCHNRIEEEREACEAKGGGWRWTGTTCEQPPKPPVDQTTCPKDSVWNGSRCEKAKDDDVPGVGQPDAPHRDPADPGGGGGEQPPRDDPRSCKDQGMVWTGAECVSATPKPLAPGSPAPVSAVVVKRSSTQSADGEIRVTWSPADANGDPITEYVVTVDSDENPVSADQTSLIVGNLRNGVDYTVTVFARNRVGDGPVARSSVRLDSSAPGPVTGLTAAAGDGAITVDFGEPTDDGGSAITRYDLEVATGSTPVKSLTATAAPVRIDGLQNGAAHTVTVRARNEGGQVGPPTTSPPVTPRTALVDTPAVTCGAGGAGSSQSSASWGAVDRATSYRVMRGATTLATQSGTSYAEPTTQGGPRYDYAVVAIAADGVESNPGTCSTTVPPPGGTSLRAATAPQTVQHGVDLSWDPVAGAAGYRVFQEGGQVADGVQGLSHRVDRISACVPVNFGLAAVDRWGRQGPAAGAAATPSNRAPTAQRQVASGGWRANDDQRDQPRYLGDGVYHNIPRPDIDTDEVVFEQVSKSSSRLTMTTAGDLAVNGKGTTGQTPSDTITFRIRDRCGKYWTNSNGVRELTFTVDYISV